MFLSVSQDVHARMTALSVQTTIRHGASVLVSGKLLNLGHGRDVVFLHEPDAGTA